MSSFSFLIAPARTSSTVLNRMVKIHLILVLRVGRFQFFILYTRMRLLDDVSDSVDMSLSRVGVLVMHRGAWYATVHGIEKSWT